MYTSIQNVHDSLLRQEFYYLMKTANIFTPACWQWPKRVITIRFSSHWKQKSVGHLVHLSTGTPCLKLLNVVYHIGVGTLPCGSPCVVINIVDSSIGIQPTFPAALRQHKILLIKTLVQLFAMKKACMHQLLNGC